MSKISQYLNEHLLGDTTTSTAVRRILSTDSSMLSMMPDVVVYPRVTNDIRKVLRFTYQLAQKGHAISVVARGAGTDQTGAAIGQGIVLNTTAHMNTILEFDGKQRLIRVQPGANFGAVNTALKLQGCFIPAYPDSAEYSTIGGAVANNASGRLSGQHGAIDESVSELEVVLANGDVIQTTRISKKVLSKKKGLQTLEGEIYRTVDNLITDNQALIDEQLDTNVIDNSGYATLRKVKQKNGSFDLTPLFIGSQGTLGVISEMIMKAEFFNTHDAFVAALLPDAHSFIDFIDELRAVAPDILEIYDAMLAKQAHVHGKRYQLMNKAAEQGVEMTTGGVVLCGFRDFSERVRKKKIKKVAKLAQKHGGVSQEAFSPEALAEVSALRGLPHAAVYSDEKNNVVPSLFRGVYIPHGRFEECLQSLRLLEKTSGVTLPFSGYATDGVYNFWPQFTLRSATEKQKLLKLYDTFTNVVYDHGGSIVAEAGEGRLKMPFIQKHTDPNVSKMYADLRAIFDPYGTLNHGVKQPTELRSVVAHLRPGYEGVDEADYSSPS